MSRSDRKLPRRQDLSLLRARLLLALRNHEKSLVVVFSRKVFFLVFQALHVATNTLFASAIGTLAFFSFLIAKRVANQGSRTLTNRFAKDFHTRRTRFCTLPLQENRKRPFSLRLRFHSNRDGRTRRLSQLLSKDSAQADCACIRTLRTRKCVFNSCTPSARVLLT